MSWANEEDLLTGDIPLHNIDTGHYLQLAEDEILVHLGQYYDLDTLPDPLPTVIESMLRLSQPRIATGRLLLAQSMLSKHLHAYGLKLLEEGQFELYKIGSSVSIAGATAASTGSTSSSSTSVPYASVVTADDMLSESPFDTYERWAHGLDDSAYVDYWS